MYYYEKYNVIQMILSFGLFTFLFLFLLKSKLSSIIDPLVSNIIWCSSGLSLLMGYISAKSINLDSLSFILVYIIYIIGLYLYLDKSPRSIEILQKGLNDKKNVTIFTICLILNIASRYDFITYAISHPSIASWFLYKFTQWHGRSFWQYILQIGARPFFTYYIFILLKTRKQGRFVLVVILISNSVLDIIAGGRSSLLGLLEAYGYFIFYFYPLFAGKTIKKLNWYGIGFLIISLLNSIVVTSFYNDDRTIGDGALHMANRVLSAGDGLEMYLVNNASIYIESGVIEYIKATFGIFLKQILPVETQSIGWKLYELNNGYLSPISVGPNFILPLQVIVLGKIFLLPYTLLVSFLTAFFRGNKFSKKYISSQPLSFVLGLLTFQLVVDAEFFVLQLCACLFVYFIFIFPVRKITIVFDWVTVFPFFWQKLLIKDKSKNNAFH
ncbi:hypothetical protein GO755_05940 [Spirosoma sp. HMF4905]|uniref:Oligosaccharide repeat unit polymerase n=1 Tax=Spirosoma arboris TaxID=2682092 RepID=A0A7K1S707_9BACT|nr:hypothetical protein [Spirosoma arboris]MVM29565.1 hypothetical protein [Spirosoma arboris]